MFYATPKVMSLDYKALMPYLSAIIGDLWIALRSSRGSISTLLHLVYGLLFMYFVFVISKLCEVFFF